MRVRRIPLSAAALTVVLVAGAAEAAAQQPTTRDTSRTPTTGTAGGEVARPGRVTKDVPMGTPTAPAPTPTPTTTTSPTSPGTTTPDTTSPSATPMATPMTTPMTTPAPATTEPSTGMPPTSGMAPSAGTMGGTMSGTMGGADAAPIVASLQTDAHAMALLHESNVGEVQAAQRALREASDSAVRAYAQRMITEHTALDAQLMQLGQQLNVAPALPDSTLPMLQQRELEALPSGTGGITGDPTRDPSTTPASGSALTGVTPATTPGGTSPASSPMPGTMDSTRAATGAPGTPGAMAGHAGHDMRAMGGGAPNAFDRAYIAQQVVAHARTLQLVEAAIQRGQQAELRTVLETQVRPRVQAHLTEAQEIQQRIGNQ